jgi:hypothetical protein
MNISLKLLLKILRHVFPDHEICIGDSQQKHRVWISIDYGPYEGKLVYDLQTDIASNISNKWAKAINQEVQEAIRSHEKSKKSKAFIPEDQEMDWSEEAYESEKHS